jgi:ribonuclease Z
MAALFRSLTFLGTASGTPSITRNVSSYCLSWTDGSVWMLDCGEGTQHQLLRCQDISLGRIEKIFITHLHGDHCWGLPGLLCSLAMLWTPPGVVPNATLLMRKKLSATKDDAEDNEEEESQAVMVHDHFSLRSQYLEIYGPPKTGSFLREVLRSSEAQFGFQYRINEIVMSNASISDEQSQRPVNLLRDEAQPRWIYPVVPGARHYEVLAATAYTPKVMAAELDHRVTSVGYAVTEPTTPGTLDMSRVASLGVPKGPLLSRLKSGEAVEFTDPSSGLVRRVRPDEVVGAAAPGRTALLLGDTCNSDEMLRVAPGADWVVHESTFDNSKAHLAVPRGHSTAKMAGEFAQKLGAKNLILTHFSARYPSSQKDPGAMEAIRSEAQAAFSLGPVFVADDFLTFDLSRKRREVLPSQPHGAAASAPSKA